MSLRPGVGQRGQAVIEYIFVLAFIMVMLASFIRSYSAAVSRNIQTLNYTLTQSLSTAVCEEACLVKPGSFANPLEP